VDNSPVTQKEKKEKKRQQHFGSSDGRTEKSTAAGFARALHHAPLTYRSLMDPSQLETLSTCAAGLELGVIRLFAC